MAARDSRPSRRGRHRLQHTAIRQPVTPSSVTRSSKRQVAASDSCADPKPAEQLIRLRTAQRRLDGFRNLSPILHRPLADATLALSIGCGAVPPSQSGVSFATYPLNRSRRTPRAVERASHTQPTPVQHVRAGHRRFHVDVPQQLLHRPHVVAVFQQGRGQSFKDFGPLYGPADGLSTKKQAVCALPGREEWTGPKPRRGADETSGAPRAGRPTRTPALPRPPAAWYAVCRGTALNAEARRSRRMTRPHGTQENPLCGYRILGRAGAGRTALERVRPTDPCRAHCRPYGLPSRGKSALGVAVLCAVGRRC